MCFGRTAQAAPPPRSKHKGTFSVKVSSGQQVVTLAPAFKNFPGASGSRESDVVQRWVLKNPTPPARCPKAQTQSVNIPNCQVPPRHQQDFAGAGPRVSVVALRERRGDGNCLGFEFGFLVTFRQLAQTFSCQLYRRSIVSEGCLGRTADGMHLTNAACSMPLKPRKRVPRPRRSRGNQ